MTFLLLFFFFVLQSQRTSQRRNTRANQTLPTQTSQPKTHIRGRTESTNSRETTDHLVSTKTLTFPDRVRSPCRTTQPDSSGEARRGGREAPQTNSTMTTGRYEMHRVLLHLFQHHSRTPKNPSNRRTTVELSSKDQGMEGEEEVGTWAERLKGDRLRIIHQRQNYQTPIWMSRTGEETRSSRTE